MARAKSSAERLYADVKASAKDRIGGERAYWIVGGTIRRMAVSDRVLAALAVQDEDHVSDEAVRRMLADLWSLLAADPDFHE